METGFKAQRESQRKTFFDPIISLLLYAETQPEDERHT